MKIRIHRGAHEIGGNCIELVAEAGTRIVLDSTLMDGKATSHECSSAGPDPRSRKRFAPNYQLGAARGFVVRCRPSYAAKRWPALCDPGP